MCKRLEEFWIQRSVSQLNMSEEKRESKLNSKGKIWNFNKPTGYLLYIFLIQIYVLLSRGRVLKIPSTEYFLHIFHLRFCQGFSGWIPTKERQITSSPDLPSMLHSKEHQQSFCTNHFDLLLSGSKAGRNLLNFTEIRGSCTGIAVVDFKVDVGYFQLEGVQ